MRPRRFGWFSSITGLLSLSLLLSSSALGGLAFAQAPVAAPPAAPVETAPPAAAPEPLPPPPSIPPPPAFTPVAPVVATPPAVVVPPPPLAIPMAPPLKIENAIGSIRLGLLLQPQFESVSGVSTNGYANNLFLRRARILLGGTLFGSIDYFVETDAPNAFKAPVGAPAMGQALKSTPAMFIQDAFATLKPLGDLLKVDAGYMLPPLSHNAVQGAGTLFGWDYFAYTFRQSDVFGATVTPVGRDLGVQLRGLVVGGHVEYRVGAFQGQRNAAIAPVVADPAMGIAAAPGVQGARNFFRVAARLQFNVFDAEPGFFYAGTYLGNKRILSFGGAYDFEADYKSYHVDGIVDMRLGPGVVTGQVDYSHWDGGTYLTAGTVTPKQWAIDGEAGYTFVGIKFAPIVRIEHLSEIQTATGTVLAGAITRYAGGLAYWDHGHNSNLKLFYTRIQQNNAPHGANQINLQWQVYFF